MKKLFFLSLIFLFTLPLSSFAGTCPWTNIYNNNQVEQVSPQVKPGLDENGQVQYETCAEAVARRKHQVEKEHAMRNAGKTITGGSRQNCTWTAPLPPHTEETLTVKKIGEDEEGNPQYESCTNAQRRRQEQWINTEFNGHREDAEAAIEKERQRLEEKAMSANEKAQKAADKQKKTSMIAVAGGMAAGVTAAACYSSCGSGGGGCCSAAPYFAALSAGLGLAGLALGLASKDNKQISAQYKGGLLDDPNMGGEGPPQLGSTDGSILPPGGALPDPNTPIAFNDTEPTTIKINDEEVTPTFENFGPFLKDHGLKWDPNKKSVTLPNGKSYTADDADNPEFRKYAASGPALALQKQIKGLEGQINKALGDSVDDALASGLDEEGETSLGGGGFAGYSGGATGGTGAMMVASLGRKPGSAGGGANTDSKVAGMSVKMGKNRVGVSQDNIFEMIHRRYQAKRKKQQFIELNL